jgi:hypothetical protein
MAAKPFDRFAVSRRWAHDQLWCRSQHHHGEQVASQTAIVRSGRAAAARQQKVGERPCDTLRGS